MKIFISWSGEQSKAVAEILRDWIKIVVQATEPFISTRDIDRGAIWFASISGELKETSIGIVCLTNENKNEPWILFEAGALAEGLSSARVCTLLIDLQPTDVQDPLAQFNHTLPQRESMWELIKTINNRLPENKLGDALLKIVFENNFPIFESQFNVVLAKRSGSSKPKVREDRDLLVEILETTRAIHSRMRIDHLSESSQRLTIESNQANIRMIGEKAGLTAVGESIELIRKGFTRDQVLDYLSSTWKFSPSNAEAIFDRANVLYLREFAKVQPQQGEPGLGT